MAPKIRQRTAKALASLRISAGSPEPLLFADVFSGRLFWSPFLVAYIITTRSHGLAHLYFEVMVDWSGRSVISLVFCLCTMRMNNDDLSDSYHVGLVFTKIPKWEKYFDRLNLCQKGFKGKFYISKRGNSAKMILSPFWKGIYSTRKEYGSKIFPFRVDPFSEGTWCAREQTGSLKDCLVK